MQETTAEFLFPNMEHDRKFNNLNSSVITLEFLSDSMQLSVSWKEPRGIGWRNDLTYATISIGSDARADVDAPANKSRQRSENGHRDSIYEQ